jgi:hypothetical protein
MNEAQPAGALLVSGPYQVTAGDRGAPPRPNEALVYTTADGTVFELAKRPGAIGQAKYSYRYVVDMGDHGSSWEDQLPSGTGGFGFQAAVTARWRVENASEAVSRNLTTVAEGEYAVRSAVTELLLPCAERYGIESKSELSDFIRSTFYGREHHLDVGLVVTALTVRLQLDPLALDHLRQVKQQEFDRQLATAQHATHTMMQGYEAELQSTREQAILAAARGEGGLIVSMLAREPDKMREILDDLAKRHDIAVAGKMQVLEMLVNAKMIQPAEAQAIWQEMGRPVAVFGSGVPAGPAAPAVQASPPSTPLQMLTQAAAAPTAAKPPTPRYQGTAPQPQPRRLPPGPASPAAAAHAFGPDPEDEEPATPAAGRPAPPPNTGSAPPASGNVVGSVPVGRAKRSDG